VPTLTAPLPLWGEGLFQPARYKVVYGGRGKGASWTFARALLVKAAAEPLRVGCFREFQKSIKDSVHRLLVDQIALLGLPGYEITDREIRHATGSLFLFEGLRHNVTKIKSLEGIDVAWVEEAERVSEKSWNVLIPTIRRPGSEIWVTFNTDEETDPTYQRFVVHPPPGAWVRKVGWQENPWFPDELRSEKDYLYAIDPDEADTVWGGNPRERGAAQVLRGKWVVDVVEPAATWQGPYFGCDFGFATDPNVLVCCWIAPGTRPGSTGRLMIQREAWKLHEDTDAIPDHWRRVMPDAPRYVIRGDAARPETISYLRRHGFPRIESAPKWAGSVEDGVAHLRQFEQIVIDPDCVHAQDEAKHYKHKVDELTGDVLPDFIDAHNHVWDAVRYALAPLIKQRRRAARPYTSTASVSLR
jgi:phage terminase large subunit